MTFETICRLHLQKIKRNIRQINLKKINQHAHNVQINAIASLVVFWTLICVMSGHPAIDSCPHFLDSWVPPGPGRSDCLWVKRCHGSGVSAIVAPIRRLTPLLHRWWRPSLKDTNWGVAFKNLQQKPQHFGKVRLGMRTVKVRHKWSLIIDLVEDLINKACVLKGKRVRMPQVKQHTALLVVISVRVGCTPANRLARPNSCWVNVTGAMDRGTDGHKLPGNTNKSWESSHLEQMRKAIPLHCIH